MIPIQKLLSQMRWDGAFSQAEFIIGYYDRIEKRMIKVRFEEIIFAPDDHFAFQLVDDEGYLHNVPYHRVKQVLRDGELIWHREH